MKKQLITLLILLASTTLYAKQYPDSVRAAAAAECRIEQGLNIDISGGAGAGRFAFGKMFGGYVAPHSQNAFAYPLWNGAIGINYYFLPWLGAGTGAQLSNYANTTSIAAPWSYNGTDAQGDYYTFTATPEGIEAFLCLRVNHIADKNPTETRTMNVYSMVFFISAHVLLSV